MHPSKKRKLLGEGECNIIFLEVGALSRNRSGVREKLFLDTGTWFYCLMCVCDSKKNLLTSLQFGQLPSTFSTEVKLGEGKKHLVG
jgi:hypothetical protein